MRLTEYSADRLDEKLTFRRFITASLMGSAALGTAPARKEPAVIKQELKLTRLDEPKKVKGSDLDLVRAITARYKVDPLLASQVVDLARKHARPTFPTARDILSVIGIESSFNPLASSKLRFDPAKGLMQVRAGMWRLQLGELSKIEGQIKHGVNILVKYHEKLGSAEAALKAYNVGLTRYRRDRKDPRAEAYYTKFSREHARYDG